MLTYLGALGVSVQIIRARAVDLKLSWAVMLLELLPG